MLKKKKKKPFEVKSVHLSEHMHLLSRGGQRGGRGSHREADVLAEGDKASLYCSSATNVCAYGIRIRPLL